MVKNSCAEEPKIIGDTLQTTKSNADMHGYGTKSIKKAAKKYNGECEWHYDENGHSFLCTVLFNKAN